MGQDYLEPEARWNLFENASGSDLYPDLDRFGRVIQSRWTSYKGTGTRDFYHVSLAYDANGNITSAVDRVHRVGVGGGDGLDSPITMSG